ncbi:MAG TPA: RNase H family protein, partial [Acidimicrobiales bacterium]|nr:RNase H family protein [Acidimicrobiales bacterium]
MASSESSHSSVSPGSESGTWVEKPSKITSTILARFCCDPTFIGSTVDGGRATMLTVEPQTSSVFTDGACIGNPGPGGWAWARGEDEFASGFEDHTTNQRMELTAALEAARSFDGPLQIVSDSMYVVNCFKDRWWEGWRRRGWRGSRGAPVANRDLWEPLVAIVIDERPGEIAFRWVKGH